MLHSKYQWYQFPGLSRSPSLVGGPNALHVMQFETLKKRKNVEEPQLMWEKMREKNAVCHSSSFFHVFSISICSASESEPGLHSTSASHGQWHGSAFVCIMLWHAGFDQFDLVSSAIKKREYLSDQVNKHWYGSWQIKLYNTALSAQ